MFWGINTFFVLLRSHFISRLMAPAKMFLRRVQNISFPANIDSIVLRRCDTAQVFVHLVL